MCVAPFYGGGEWARNRRGGEQELQRKAPNCVPLSYLDGDKSVGDGAASVVVCVKLDAYKKKESESQRRSTGFC